MAKLDNGPARGTRDLLPSEVRRREAVVSIIEECYARHGFRRIETPSIENIERLTGGQGGENEKLIFSILKRGLPDRVPAATPLASLVDLGLRYDLTVPLARFYANNHAQLPTPFRSLQIGSAWRAERPARGRFRQFTQCDIDVIGERSVLAECELLEATVATLAALGIAPATVRLNDRRLLLSIAAAAGLESDATGSYFVVLDKLDKIGWDGVLAELEQRGFDAEVGERTREMLESLQLLSLEMGVTPPEVLAETERRIPGVADDVLAGLKETAETVGALAGCAGSEDGVSLVIDPTVVRGMGYYTGQIFEVGHGSLGMSIAGGGRYDDLVGVSLGRPVPACGISIGFERVVDLAAVELGDLGVAILHGDEPRPVVLAAARAVRASGRAASLVPRKKATRQQLESLLASGYSGFVTFDDGGSASSVRELSADARSESRPDPS